MILYVKRSLSEMGVMLTMLTTGIKPGGLAGSKSDAGAGNSSKTDVLVMETKSKIIEILQFILDVRLDYRTELQQRSSKVLGKCSLKSLL